MKSQQRPWIQCPCCWIPIEIPTNQEVGEHKCINPTCPLSSLKVRVKVFASRQEAKEAREKESNTFLIGEIERFLNISDDPVKYWGYFYCSEPIDRFRLLHGRPLERLVSENFVANWELGVATQTRPKRPFTTFMIQYDKDSGQVMTYKDNNPKLIPVSRYYENSLSPITTQYCTACKLIREKCVERKKADTGFIDPCLECNCKLAASLFKKEGMSQEELRLAVGDPEHKSKQLFDKLRHICWLGLLDMTFPIMVADIIVGVVFTGQLRLKGASLPEEEKERRRGILSELGLSEEDIVGKIEEMPEISITEAKKVWRELRDSAHQLQMICASRYGQMGAVRESLLAGKLRNHVRATPMLSRTKSKILSKVGYEALKEIGIFFSFQRATMIIRDGGEWKGAACWESNQQIRDDLPMAVEADLVSDMGGMPSPAITVRVGTKLWPDIRHKSYYYWVRGDRDTWYLFMVRRFEKKDKPRAKLNRFSQHLVREITLTFHQEILSLLSTHQQIENIQHIVHNLGGPGAALSSTLAAFDASVYGAGEHLGKMTALSEDYRFLKQAINALYTDIERSRRRIAFEVRKFEVGIDIEKQLKKGGKKIAIFDATSAPGEGPSGLWNKALWSFDMYGRDMSIRNITLEQVASRQGLDNKHIKINENTLQIVLDNMVDNAVKYAYDDTEIDLKIYIKEIKGQGYCMLSIGNFGNGILENEIDKVWERLYRGICSTTRKKQVSGSGLGMFIIKKVVGYYGGQVGIESHFGGAINYKPGEGFYTKVQIALPLLRKEK